MGLKYEWDRAGKLGELTYYKHSIETLLDVLRRDVPEPSRVGFDDDNFGAPSALWSIGRTAFEIICYPDYCSWWDLSLDPCPRKGSTQEAVAALLAWYAAHE